MPYGHSSAMDCAIADFNLKQDYKAIKKAQSTKVVYPLHDIFEYSGAWLAFGKIKLFC
jgi:hypothetical protein